MSHRPHAFNNLLNIQCGHYAFAFIFSHVLLFLLRWLMSEAKKRNPSIKLYGLPWAFPAWVGNGTGSPYAYPNMTADYVVKWVGGAKTVYNLDIDYVVCFC